MSLYQNNSLGICLKEKKGLIVKCLTSSGAVTEKQLVTSRPSTFLII